MRGEHVGRDSADGDGTFIERDVVFVERAVFFERERELVDREFLEPLVDREFLESGRVEQRVVDVVFPRRRRAGG